MVRFFYYTKNRLSISPTKDGRYDRQTRPYITSYYLWCADWKSPVSPLRDGHKPSFSVFR